MTPNTKTFNDPVKDDFRNFLFLIWKHLGLPAPTWLQYDIAEYLQYGPRRRIVEALRGIGKSWITAAYVLWLLHRDAEERIMVVSASKERADAFSIFTKRLIAEVPFLQYLRPNDKQRDSNVAFDVGPSKAHQAPSVRSVGITGQLTGGRATRIVADDVEVPKNSLTQAMRDKLSELVKEFDAILVPGGEITYLGTPQTEMSLYNLLPQRGYEIRIWPARFPNPKLLERYGNRLAPAIVARLEADPSLQTACGGKGAPTEPSRFSDTDLLQREASYGRSGFAMQFMLDTAASDIDRYPLKLSDLIVMGLTPGLAPVRVAWGSGPEQVINDLPNVGLTGDRLHRPIFVAKDFLEYQGVAMAIDPSGRGGDELGYAIVAMLNGTLYLLRCRGLKGGYSDENLQTIADEAKRYAVKQLIIEDNFGDGMFTKLLTPFLVRTYPVTTEGVRHSTQKEKRIIDTLEPVLNQHRLVVDERVVSEDFENYNGYADEHAQKYQLFYQMTRLTKDRGSLAKDDRIDVLAMAVAYWVEQMDKDVQESIKEHRANLLQEELDKFSEQVLGGGPRRTSWTSRKPKQRAIKRVLGWLRNRFTPIKPTT